MLLVAHSTSALAQTSTTDLLTAPRVAQRLTVEVTEGSGGFAFDVRRDTSGPQDLNEGQLFAAIGPIRVLLQPFKPLKYAYSVKIEGVADENAADLAKFAQGLLSLGAVLRPDLSDLAEAAKRVTQVEMAMTKSAVCDPAEVAKVSAALKLLSEALNVEAARTLEETFEKHVDAGDDNALRAAATGLASAASSIRVAITAAEAQLEKLRESRNALQPKPECGQVVQSLYALDTGGPILRLENLRVMATNLEAVVEGLRSFTRWEGQAYVLTRDVLTMPNEGKKVTLTVAKRNFTVSQTTFVERNTSAATSRTFALRRARSLVPELGVGFVVSRVKQPKYGTAKNDAGETIVSRADDEDVSYDGALMLNLVCRCKSGGGVFPMLQLGVSPDRDRPAVLGGLGLRFGGIQGLKHVGVAFGGILAFPKDLTKLSVGDVVDGTTAIESDLDFKPTVKAYFTIQYSF